MDAQPIIEAIQSGVKDKNLLVRFYALHNGTDLWIDGVTWFFYNLDMEEYLRGEFGIDYPDALYDVIDSNDEFIQRTCFVDGVFKTHSRYEEIQQLLNEYPEEAIEACISLSIPLDKMEESYRGQYKTFAEFVEEQYRETSELDNDILKYFDWERVAEDWEGQFYFEKGFVFDATVG